jgi:type IV pilus assembly protein PilE
MKTPSHSQTGFTLIEVMIVVVVVAVLSAIAYPSYTAYIQRSHRADAKNALMAVAQRLEQNYALSGRYDQNQAGGAIDAAFIAATGFDTVPPGGGARYNISFVAGTLGQGTYRLQAVPAGGQAGDPCGTLLLNQQGVRGAGGVLGNRAQLTLDCWNR